MSYDVGHRCGLDPTLLWLWHRPVVAALIRPLGWELSYAKGVDLKTKKKRNKQKNQKHKSAKLIICKVHNTVKKKLKTWSSCHGTAEMNPTRNLGTMRLGV